MGLHKHRTDFNIDRLKHSCYLGINADGHEQYSLPAARACVKWRQPAKKDLQALQHQRRAQGSDIEIVISTEKSFRTMRTGIADRHREFGPQRSGYYQDDALFMQLVDTPKDKRPAIHLSNKRINEYHPDYTRVATPTALLYPMFEAFGIGANRVAMTYMVLRELTFRRSLYITVDNIKDAARKQRVGISTVYRHLQRLAKHGFAVQTSKRSYKLIGANKIIAARGDTGINRRYAARFNRNQFNNKHTPAICMIAGMIQAGYKATRNIVAKTKTATTGESHTALAIITLGRIAKELNCSTDAVSSILKAAREMGIIRTYRSYSDAYRHRGEIPAGEMHRAVRYVDRAGKPFWLIAAGSMMTAPEVMLTKRYPVREDGTVEYPTTWEEYSKKLAKLRQARAVEVRQRQLLKQIKRTQLRKAFQEYLLDKSLRLSPFPNRYIGCYNMGNKTEQHSIKTQRYA